MTVKYSLTEIDRMRRLIRQSYPAGVPYYESERSADVERRLGTYMANGTTVGELEDYVATKHREAVRPGLVLGNPKVN